MNKESKICVLLVLAFAWDYTKAKTIGVTKTVSRCPGECIPPRCSCNEPPLSSNHIHKLCLDGSQAQCPVNLCSVPEVKPCIKLKKNNVKNTQKRILRAIEDLHRSKRSNEPVIFEDGEVEFCEESKYFENPNCFPICTKDVTSLCVALEYKEISEENQL